MANRAASESSDTPVARRQEKIISGRCQPILLPTSVEIREFATHKCQAEGFSTGTATFPPAGELANHTHTLSEAITILSGTALVCVEERAYRLSRLDCIHIPHNTPHRVFNEAQDTLIALWSFGSAIPSRQFVDDDTPVSKEYVPDPKVKYPEQVIYFDATTQYELAPGAIFCDLFAKRFGSVGICGGYGRFQPGASLPCHTHEFDESITIVEGEAVCLVQGRVYNLANLDTAFVPKGKAHRFINKSEQHMAMVWVYAGDEPERTVIDDGYCEGTLAGPAWS